MPTAPEPIAAMSESALQTTGGADLATKHIEGQGHKTRPLALTHFPSKWDSFGTIEEFKPVGQGASGDVYVKTQHGVPKFAIKVFKPTVRRDVFELEIETMKHFRDSKFFINFYDSANASDFMWDEGPNMILMEGASMTVFDAIEKYGGLYEAQAVEVIVDLLCGLKTAHDLGFIYRDVKPENILVKIDSVKYGDLGGLCKPDGDDKFACQGYMGTFIYASPQLWARFMEKGVWDPWHAQQTHEDDVYALGLVLAFMITGGYVPKTVMEVQSVLDESNIGIEYRVERILGILDRFDISKDALMEPLAAPIQSLLRKMMAKDPVQRCTAAQCLEFIVDDEESHGLFTREERRQAVQCAGVAKKRKLQFGDGPVRKKLKLDPMADLWTKLQVRVP